MGLANRSNVKRPTMPTPSLSLFDQLYNRIDNPLETAQRQYHQHEQQRLPVDVGLSTNSRFIGSENPRLSHNQSH